MDKEDIFRLAKNPRFISGIYNYVDLFPFDEQPFNIASVILRESGRLLVGKSEGFRLEGLHTYKLPDCGAPPKLHNFQTK